MSRKRLGKYLLIAFFIAALYLPNPVWSLWPHKDISTGENRDLAPFPAFSLQSLKTWPRDFEAWYNDHLPFRSKLVGANNLIQQRVFHASANQDVLIGQNGWLFYNNPEDGDPIGQYKGEKRFTREELESIARRLTDFDRQLRARGKEFVLFIAPNKERVYADQMPPYLGACASGDAYAPEQMISYLRAATDIRIVYPFDALLEARAHETRPLYYATDTHWNALGSYVASRSLLNELGVSLPELAQLTVTDEGAYAGDLAGMLNLTDALATDRLYAVSGYASGAATVEASHQNAYHSCKMPQGDPRRLFVVRDSFFTPMRPVVASCFRESASVHVNSVTPEMLTAFDPDIVVFELTERYCYRLKELYWNVLE